MNNTNSLTKRFFEQISWEKMILWGLLLLSLWIMRSFLAVIFVTFILSYLAHNATNRITAYTPMKWRSNIWCRRIIVIAIFTIFLMSLYLASLLLFPAMLKQGDQLLITVKNVDPIQKINEIAINYFGGEKQWRDVIASPPYKIIIENIQNFLTTHLTDITIILATVIKNTATFFIQFFVSIIFSFIIVLDIPRLHSQIQSLRNTRLRNFYDTITPGLQTFSNVMGKAFAAQAVIAICNTILTYIGMVFLNIPVAELMSLFVFFCSFIPVLGVFISSIPISLVALQTHGVILMLEAIALITFIHIFEAYVLNPRIMGNFLKIHPLLVLIILFVGEHFFGVWGLLLGVPVAVYIFRYAILDMPFPNAHHD